MISPGLRIGRYEVGKRLGKGGFGVVHLARDVDLDREIAIKVLRPEYLTKPQIVQRFIKEARAAAKIGHAGIVTVFECGQIQGTGTRADGNAYIAMELLVGESLGDRLLNGGRMSVAQAITITRQLAAALAAAHQAGIVHRDLKPDNVFLVPDAAVHGGERVKVLDFGVAKLLDPGEDGVNTHSQMMLGTPKYMSPEQARSAATVDHRGDIYTLGCMLFEMLTGRTPFGGDAGEQMLAHQKTPPPSARLVVSTVPSSIDALIRRMLAKSPEERPQTMSAVVDALSELDEPDTMVRAPIEVTPVDAQRVSAEITTVAEVARARPRDRRVLFIAAPAAALVLSGLVMYFVLRSDSAPKPRPRVVLETTAEIDASVVIAVDAAIDEIAPDVARLRTECLQARDAKRWDALISCGEALIESDRMVGKAFYDTGHEELRAEASYRALRTAIMSRDLANAKAALDQITVESVYRSDADRAFSALATELEPRAKKSEAKADPCAGDVLSKGRDMFASNRFAEALVQFDHAHQCKPSDLDVLRFAFASACKSKNVAKARTYWKKLSEKERDMLTSFCIANGILRNELSE